MKTAMKILERYTMVKLLLIMKIISARAIPAPSYMWLASTRASWRMFLLTNPLVPGTPATDKTPMRKTIFNLFECFPNPCTWFIESSCSIMYMIPAPRKSKTLKTAWLNIWKSVPCIAMLLWSPSMPMSPTPIRMYPNWLIELYASILLMFLWKIAKNPPQNIFPSPSTNMPLEISKSFLKMTIEVIIIPNTPVFKSIPERIALAGAGAAGWAFGSHT